MSNEAALMSRLTEGLVSWLGFEQAARRHQMYDEYFVYPPIFEMAMWAAAGDGIHNGDGFNMGFRANYHPIKLDTGMIFPLLERTREICDVVESPAPRDGCKECEKVATLIKVGV